MFNFFAPSYRSRSYTGNYCDATAEVGGCYGCDTGCQLSCTAECAEFCVGNVSGNNTSVGNNCSSNCQGNCFSISALIWGK